MRFAAVALTIGTRLLLLPAVATGQRVDTTRTAPDSARIDSARAHGLAPVIVAGARLSTRANRRTATRVDAIDVRNSPPGPASAADALARLPGVSLTNDQGSRAQPTVEFRGFTLSPVAGVPQGVSVFLDGVRVNEPDAQEVNFDLLPTDAIRRAELIRGPSAIFGKNTLGGALTLSTVRGGLTPRVTVTADEGSFGYRAVHALGSGMWSGIDGTLSAKATREDGYQVESGSTTRQLFSTVGRKTGGSDLALSLLYGRDKVYEAGSLPESWLNAGRRANYSAGDFFRPELIQGSLRGTRARGASTVRGNMFARRNATEQFNVNAQDPDSRAFVTNKSLGGTTELDVLMTIAGLPTALSVGGEYTHTDVKYRVFGEPNATVPDVPPHCDAQTRLCEDARIKGDDGALFAQATMQLTGRLSLLAAGRGDAVRVPFRDLRDAKNNGTTTFWHLSPRVGLTYLGENHIRLYGSTGSGFRAPAALELACASPTAPCPLPFSLGADPP
ncbi:MAG: TonB-dependent receptor, partial [Gemmatimonadaceae bacterium]